MLNIDHILVPIDFSETSEAALTYAIDLSEQLDADVTVLHVREPIYGMMELGGPDVADWAEKLDVASRSELQRAVDRHQRARSRPLKTVMVAGIPYGDILRVAEEENADLIVMGTHGRTGLPHMLLGSVAERLVRSSPIPVLTVRAPASKKE